MLKHTTGIWYNKLSNTSNTPTPNGTSWQQVFGHKINREPQLAASAGHRRSANMLVSTGRTPARHAWCDSVSDADIRRVDGRRHSLSLTWVSCTPSRSDFLLSANNTTPTAYCIHIWAAQNSSLSSATATTTTTAITTTDLYIYILDAVPHFHDIFMSPLICLPPKMAECLQIKLTRLSQSQ